MRDWRDAAACAGMDPELWFPVCEQPRMKSEQQRLRLALDTCASCAVQAECLEFAMRTGQLGIWGGTTEKWRNSRRGRELRQVLIS